MNEPRWYTIPDRLHVWKPLPVYRRSLPRPSMELEDWLKQINDGQERVKTYAAMSSLTMICFLDDGAHAEFILRFGSLDA